MVDRLPAVGALVEDEPVSAVGDAVAASELMGDGEDPAEQSVVIQLADGLDMPEQAKQVRAGKDGEPITDGVFPESKEFLAGYWIVDVENPERAYQIAARASAAPGPGGIPLNMAIEVRQIMGGPPEEFR